MDEDFLNEPAEADFHEVSSQSDEEDESLFEIHDFSTASDWEKFIDEIEQTIHSWTEQFSQQKQEFRQGTFFTQQKHLVYSGKKYEIVYYNSDTSTMDDDEDEDEEAIGKVEKILLNDENDFPSRTHHLNRWYGVDEFFIVSVNKSGKRLRQRYTIQEQQRASVIDNEAASRTMSMSEAKILQSAMIIALHNTPLRQRLHGGSYSIPLFVTVGRPADCEYVGRWQHGSTVVKFRSEVVLNQKTAIPPLYTKVSGLFDLFCLLMGKHLTLRDVSNHIRLYAKYTYILDSMSVLYHLLQKIENENLSFGCMYADEPPIKSYYLSPRLQPDMHNLESMQIEQLNPYQATTWQIRCEKDNNPRCKLSNLLYLFVKEMYLKALQEVSNTANEISQQDDNYINTDGSLYGKVFNSNKPRVTPARDTVEDDFSRESIRSALKAIFRTEEYRDMTHERGLPKSCPPSSLLSRFCREAIKLEDWEELRRLWSCFVQKLRVFWDLVCDEDGDHSYSFNQTSKWYIPHTDSEIEWTSCLLEQKINMLNICCLIQADNMNKKVEPQEENVESDLDAFSDEDDFFEKETRAKINNQPPRGVLRTMKLDNGRIINIPITQQVPPKTEDMITEHQQILSSLDNDQRANFQSAPLRSDMEAFKAANPNGNFYDFLSWYSPKDIEGDEISKRMKESNNMWQKNWDRSKAVPVSQQRPLFDHKKEAEIVLRYLEMLDISNYMNQVMVCAFVSSYYDISRWWKLYSKPYRNIDTVDASLADLKSSLNKVLSHAVMLPEPLLDLTQRFKKCEALISQAVCHIEMFKSELGNDLVQDMVEKLLLPETDDVILHVQDSVSLKELLMSKITHDPDAREYRFRCVAPRPYSFSKPTAQSMYVLYSNNEFRICTALSEAL